MARKYLQIKKREIFQEAGTLLPRFGRFFSHRPGVSINNPKIDNRKIYDFLAIKIKQQKCKRIFFFRFFLSIQENSWTLSLRFDRCAQWILFIVAAGIFLPKKRRIPLPTIFAITKGTHITLKARYFISLFFFFIEFFANFLSKTEIVKSKW